MLTISRIIKFEKKTDTLCSPCDVVDLNLILKDEDYNLLIFMLKYIYVKIFMLYFCEDQSFGILNSKRS